MTSSLVIKTETHTSLGEYGRDKKLYLKQAPWKHPNGKIQNTKIKEQVYTVRKVLVYFAVCG